MNLTDQQIDGIMVLLSIVSICAGTFLIWGLGTALIVFGLILWIAVNLSRAIEKVRKP